MTALSRQTASLWFHSEWDVTAEQYLHIRTWQAEQEINVPAQKAWQIWNTAKKQPALNNNERPERDVRGQSRNVINAKPRSPIAILFIFFHLFLFYVHRNVPIWIWTLQFERKLLKVRYAMFTIVRGSLASILSNRINNLKQHPSLHTLLLWNFLFIQPCDYIFQSHKLAPPTARSKCRLETMSVDGMYLSSVYLLLTYISRYVCSNWLGNRYIILTSSSTCCSFSLGETSVHLQEVLNPYPYEAEPGIHPGTTGHL